MEVTVGTRVRSEVMPSDVDARAILALDTSTDRATVALRDPDGGCLIAPAGESRRHGRGLVGTIRDLLRQAGLRAADLGAIGVGLGPGSFTGLRIGVTAAKTIAYAIGCRVYGFDSLEAIARNATAEAMSVVAVGDAQRGDLFAADFAREGPGRPLRRTRPTRLERAETWPALLESGTIVVGPSLGRAEPNWPASVTRLDVELGYPGGPVVIELTRERIAEGAELDVWFLEPSYVRRSAAEEKAWPIAGEAR
jgi:tRNA threonylcarbamoyladenosine biosynthesis protein TsaB